MNFRKFLVGLAFVTTIVAFPRPGYCTVSNTVVQTVTGNGNGSNTTFPITFDFRANAWITVTEYDTSTTPTTVTSVPQGAGAGKFSISGTSVIMGTAPSTTQYLVIQRNIPLVQPVVFSPGSIFPYQGLSSQFDQMTLELQNLNAGIGGVSVSSAGGSSAGFPNPGAPYDFIGWNAAASSVINTTVAYDIGQSTFQSGDILQFNGSGWATLPFTPSGIINQINLGSSPIGSGVGGTGVSNSGSLTFGSNAVTLTTTGTTNVTLPTSGTLLAGPATNNNTANTIVRRDASGSFSAGTISGNIIGSVTGNVAGNVTGNVSGTASNLTGILAIGNGGTGETTAPAALTQLTGTQTSGYYVRSDGTNAYLNPFVIADLGSYDVPRTVLQQGTANTLVINDNNGNLAPLVGGTSGNVATFNGVSWISAAPGSNIIGVQYFGVDSGVANAYVDTSVTAPLAGYVAGDTVAFIALNSNTGPSTLNVDGLGAVALTKGGGAPTTINDILAGQVITTTYDGARFQLVGPSTPTPFDVASTIMSRDAAGQVAATTFTGALAPSFTAGSIPYSNGSILVQDNFSFFWDDTSKRLGVGTAAPGAGVHIYNGLSPQLIVEHLGSPFDASISLKGGSGSNLWRFGSDYNYANAQNFYLYDAYDGYVDLFIDNAQHVGFGGNMTPAYTIDDTGTMHVTGAVTFDTPLPISGGGTGQTTASTAFNALSPMTTGGDLIYGGVAGAGTRLANGTAGQILQSNGTTVAPTWVTPSAGGGTVASVAMTVPAFLSISGSPITTSGTFGVTYSGSALPLANGGTGNSALVASSGGVLYTDGTEVQNVGAGTVGYVLTSNGTSAPSWQVASSGGASVTSNYYQGYHNTSANWAYSGAGSYSDPTITGTATLVQRKASGIIVTTATGNGPGITFTPATASSVYLIGANINWSASSSSIVSTQITDGTTVIAQGPDGEASVAHGVLAIAIPPAVYAPGTTSPVTIRVQAASSTGTADIASSTLGNGIEWTIIQIK